MNNLRASLTLTFQDNLSAGLARVGNNLNRLKEIGKGLTLGKLDNAIQTITGITNATGRMADSFRQASKSVGEMEAKVLGTYKKIQATVSRPIAVAQQWGSRILGPQSRAGGFAAAAEGLSVLAPISSAAEYSNIMRHTAITAHQYGPDADAAMAAMRLRYNTTARDTAQSSHKIAEGAFWLSLTGMSSSLVDRLVPIGAKIATAYNADAMDAYRTSFALNYNLGIKEPDMERALGMLALLGKHGHYLFGDQAKSLPGVAAAAQGANMKGMKGLEEVAAAMQISMKVVDPAQPSMAATNFESFLSQIQQIREEKLFKKYGMDLEGMLFQGAAKGISPMEVVLYGIRRAQEAEAKRRHITNPDVRAQSDSSVFAHILGGRKEAANFARAMLTNLPEYLHLKELGRGTEKGMITQDFNEALRDLSADFHQLGENATQLKDRLGFGFGPILKPVNAGLQSLIGKIETLDAKFPGLVNGVLLTVGGFLSFAATIAAIGFVWPPLVTGFTLFAGIAKMALAPVRLLATGIVWLAGGLAGLLGTTATVVIAVAAVVAVLVAAAVDIIRHWERFRDFFAEMWAGIQDVFGGFLDFLIGVFNFDMKKTWHGLQRMWGGLEKYFGGLWHTVEGLFDDFTDFVNRWTGGAATAAIEGIKSAWTGLKGFFTELWKQIRAPFDQLVNDFQASPFRKAVTQATQNAGETQDAEADAMPTWGVNPGRGSGSDKLHIYLHPDPGASASVSDLPSNLSVHGFSLDRGRTLSRP